MNSNTNLGAIFNLQDIELDNNGKVIINNPDLAEKIKNNLEKEKLRSLKKSDDPVKAMLERAGGNNCNC